jgi:NAD(P)-dependent dehydrogenase (short-subunit alcohol dehydrogenase family)
LRFKDKTTIVTGGGSGIGLETAKRLHAEGARVLLNGRDEAKLRAVAAGFGQSDRVAVFSGDIAKPATSLALVQAAEREFGGVDILINNAGVFEPIAFADVTEEQYDWFLNTILKGKFFTAQAAAKSMKTRGGGVIVNVGSMWALQAYPRQRGSSCRGGDANLLLISRCGGAEGAPDLRRLPCARPDWPTKGCRSGDPVPRVG